MNILIGLNGKNTVFAADQNFIQLCAYENIEIFISKFKIFFLGDMQKIRGLELKKESWDFFRLSN